MQHPENAKHAAVNLVWTLAPYLGLSDPCLVSGQLGCQVDLQPPLGVSGKTRRGPKATQDIRVESDQRFQVRAEGLRRLRVVIVEDEAIVAMELELLLEELGVDVVGIAASAVDATALVEKHKPDFATMDISLKGDRDGVSVAIEIFEAHGTRSVFISSYSEFATQKRAETCHPIAWVRKPIDKAKLSKAVGLVERRGG